MTGRFATLFVKQGVYNVFTLSDKLFAHFEKGTFFHHGENGAEVFPAKFPIQ